MSNVFLDDAGKTIVMNDGGPNQKDIAVPVILAGHFPPNVRVAEVRMQSGAVHTFGGELLAQAIANGARVLREIQKGK